MDDIVDELTPDMKGKWLVTTQGSTHIWDLDDMTYKRQPGKSSPQFSEDMQIVKLTRVEIWPKVGFRSMLFYDDPDDPQHVEQWRISSRIESIVRISTAEQEE